MKHSVLLIAAMCLSTSALAKVSYEDALESNRPFEEANAAVHIPPSDFGLPDDEIPDGNQGDFGHWKAINSIPHGNSAIMLLGTATGHECAPKGVYGSQSYRSCWNIGNGDKECTDKTNYYSCE
ncbi:hypothetical protein [uncultured Vibrio sp.]|uniref:hypothetical protein n=1 Tax=uncultured Vibrio sp. TaxID=114054 RepID=UPI00261AAE69|nr:hypothetical protein [uncultured Vibrio sp.]